MRGGGARARRSIFAVRAIAPIRPEIRSVLGGGRRQQRETIQSIRESVARRKAGRQEGRKEGRKEEAAAVLACVLPAACR